jgi:hypothetical protein
MEAMTTLQGLGIEVYKVAAIMCHPNDIAARRTFIASAQSDMLYRLKDAKLISDGVSFNPPRDASVLHLDRLLDEAMPVALGFKGASGRNENRDGYTGTVIAATILARALEEAGNGNDELGIAQIISDQGEEFRREGVKGTGRDSMTEIWQEHRASAHISLAFLEMGPSRRFLENPNVLFEWIGRSMDLLEAGRTVSNRFGGPILPEKECWHVLMRPSFGG